MTLSFTIILILSCILSCYTLWRSTVSIQRKLFLVVMRFLLFTLLFCAFIQPVLSINRLASYENNVSVLVDLSSSMRLFNPDSMILYFSPLPKAGEKENDRLPPRFTFFGFGDSLRPIHSLASMQFNDNNSLFPRFLNNSTLKSNNKILIISDGNWTNTISNQHALRNKECYYLPLQQRTHVSYLRTEAPNAIHSIVCDTSRTVPVLISGFTGRKDSITLTCMIKKHTLAEQKIEIDSGFFNEAHALLIPAKKSGTHLLEISAKLGDSLISNSHILHTISPSNFSVYFYAPSPSLDTRFLTLALSRKNQWTVIKEHNLNSKKPDILLIFDWDTQAQHLIKRFSKSSIVFIGCLPCDNPTTHHPSGAIPNFHSDFKHLFSNESSSDFPPLPTATTCTSAPFTIHRVLISYDSTEGSRTIPLLFEAQFKGNLVIALAARGLWRWDFWPHSIAKNRNAPFFSDFLISRIQELVQYNTNKTFYVYPQIAPLYETDSLSFKLALPSYLCNFSSLNVSFILSTLDGDTLSNVQKTSIPFYLQAHPITIPPCEQGTYLYSCAVTSENGTIIFNDSITVVADNSEFQVSGQNTVLLEELAHPVPLSAVKNIDAFFTESQSNNHVKSEIITRTFHLRRSWYMLIFLFILFSIEWIARRIWRLD